MKACIVIAKKVESYIVKLVNNEKNNLRKSWHGI